MVSDTEFCRTLNLVSDICEDGVLYNLLVSIFSKHKKYYPKRLAKAIIWSEMFNYQLTENFRRTEPKNRVSIMAEQICQYSNNSDNSYLNYYISEEILKNEELYSKLCLMKPLVDFASIHFKLIRMAAYLLYCERA